MGNALHLVHNPWSGTSDSELTSLFGWIAP
jgi:hypothetical protein